MPLSHNAIDEGSSRRKPHSRPDFHKLPNEALEHFNKISQQIAIPVGSILFKEGGPADGIYVVCTGEVKLYATSPRGHVSILKIARPGDVLGLSAALNDLPHEVAAQTISPCHLKHIAQQALQSFLMAYAEAAYMAALFLAKEQREVLLGAWRLALLSSAAARIARTLIDFASYERTTQRASSFPMILTHAELASLAGISRETVTRILNQFERDGIISRDDSTVTIIQRSRLQKLIH